MIPAGFRPGVVFVYSIINSRGIPYDRPRAGAPLPDLVEAFCICGKAQSPEVSHLRLPPERLTYLVPGIQ